MNKTTGDVAIKIRADVYRELRTVAAWEGVPVVDLVSDLLRPIMRERMKHVGRDPATPAKRGSKGGNSG